MVKLEIIHWCSSAWT